jgi:excisionase family DNA binding protein
MVSKNPDPGMTPITRALWEAIPAFTALKKVGVRIEDIAAAFKGWDAAVDNSLIATTVNRLVAVPMIDIVRPATAPQPPTHNRRFQLGTSGAADEGGLAGEGRTPEAASTLGVSNDTALQEMLTFREVAKLLGCSYGEARNRMLDGRIRAVKDGRWCRSRRDWVEEYIEQQTVRPDTPPAVVPVQVPKRLKAVNVKANGVAHRFLQNRKD